MVGPKSSLPQLYGRVGGLRNRAAHDPRETTRAAREAFLSRFERGLDPALPAEERHARVVAARRAYMAELAARSAAAARGRRVRPDRPDNAKDAKLEERIATIEERLGIAASAPSGDPDATR